MEFLFVFMGSYASGISHPATFVARLGGVHLRHTTASLLLMQGADLAAVQRIMRHQELPHVWIVNSIRIRPADLQAFLEQGTVRRERGDR